MKGIRVYDGLHDSLWPDYFLERVLTIPSSTDDRALYSAVVWGNGGRLDDLLDVFSNRPATGLSLRPSAPQVVFAAGCLADALDRVGVCGLDRVGGTTSNLETNRQRKRNNGHHWGIGCNHWRALFRTLQHRTVDSGLAGQFPSGPITLSPLCIVKPGIDVGVADVSISR